jgi:hypothetical protein
MLVLIGIPNMKYIRIFLMLPQYERITYKADEMDRISRVIYGERNPVFLVYDNNLGDDNLNLIRFFGPAYPPQANLVMTPGMASRRVPCRERVPAPVSLEKVSFCVGITADKLQELTEQGITVSSLTSLSNDKRVIGPFADEEVLRTRNYRLAIITPSIPANSER